MIQLISISIRIIAVDDGTGVLVRVDELIGSMQKTTLTFQLADLNENRTNQSFLAGEICDFRVSWLESPRC